MLEQLMFLMDVWPVDNDYSFYLIPNNYRNKNSRFEVNRTDTLQSRKDLACNNEKQTGHKMKSGICFYFSF